MFKLSHIVYSNSATSTEIPNTTPFLSKKPTKFRLSARKFFLTFSGFPADFADSLEDIQHRILQKLETKLHSLIISRENHKDGTTHFHIILSYKTKQSTLNPHYWDWIFNHHGNYQTIRNLKAAYAYITKDLNFTEWGLPIQPQQSQHLRRLIIRSLNKDSNPTLLLENKSENFHLTLYNDAHKTDVYYRRVQGLKHYNSLRKRPAFISFDLPAMELFIHQAPDSPYTPYLSRSLPIFRLINRCFKRFYKAPNILLWSHNPNMGKTSLCNLLSNLFATYDWPHDHWYENYQSNVFDFIIWDEFSLRGQKEEFLKLLFAGNPMQLPIKGSHNLKSDNPLIIATANSSLRSMTKLKRPFSCRCNSFPDDSILCNNTNDCNPPRHTLDFYKAMAARILQFEITDPIFPPGSEQPELFAEYESFLTHFIQKKPKPQTLPPNISTQSHTPTIPTQPL